MKRVAPVLAPPSLVIEPGQTVVIIGRPGAGKSTLASALLRDAGSALVYDTKGDPVEARAWAAAGFAIVDDPAELELHPRVVLRCSLDWLIDRAAWSRSRHPWGIALEHPFRRHPTAVLFDESLRVFPVAGGHPGTYRLLQQGRSFGHVPMVLSQAASNINTMLLRLAQHVVALGVLSATDAAYLARATDTDPAPLKSLPQRHIAWWRESDPAGWLTFAPLDRTTPSQFRVLGGGSRPSFQPPERSWPIPGRGPAVVHWNRHLGPQGPSSFRVELRLP